MILFSSFCFVSRVSPHFSFRLLFSFFRHFFVRRFCSSFVFLIFCCCEDNFRNFHLTNVLGPKERSEGSETLNVRISDQNFKNSNVSVLPLWGQKLHLHKKCLKKKKKETKNMIVLFLFFRTFCFHDFVFVIFVFVLLVS